MLLCNYFIYISQVYNETSDETNDSSGYLAYSEVFDDDNYIKDKSIDSIYFENKKFTTIWDRYKNKEGKTKKENYISTTKEWYNIGQNALFTGILNIELDIINKRFQISNDDKILKNAILLFNMVYLNIMNNVYWLPDLIYIDSTVKNFKLKSKIERKKFSEEEIIRYCAEYFIYNIFSDTKKINLDPIIYKIVKEYFNNTTSYEKKIKNFFVFDENLKADSEVIQILAGMIMIITEYF